MRVAVAYEVGQPTWWKTCPLPRVGPRDALVRVAASGICHTDLTVFEGVSALPLPILARDEGCETVEEVGLDVRRVAGSVVGSVQILRDFPRSIRLAEAGKLDLGSTVSERIKLDATTMASRS